MSALGEIARRYPRRKIRLFLAGGESPTLRATKAYASFSGRLGRFLERNKDVVVQPGFIPEADVPKVFAASDVVIFPYRTKMSASGAFSLALEYGKPFLVSKNLIQGAGKDFSEALAKYGVKKDAISFKMNEGDFERVLFGLLAGKALRKKLQKAGHEVSRSRSWQGAGERYAEICIKPRTLAAYPYASYAAE